MHDKNGRLLEVGDAIKTPDGHPALIMSIVEGSTFCNLMAARVYPKDQLYPTKSMLINGPVVVDHEISDDGTTNKTFVTMTGYGSWHDADKCELVATNDGSLLDSRDPSMNAPEEEPGIADEATDVGTDGNGSETTETAPSHPSAEEGTSAPGTDGTAA